MSQPDEIVNKVAKSGLVVLEMDSFLPKGEIVPFDIKPYLWEEMVLREKDFRTALTEIDWSTYEGKTVAVFCSADAIVPHWAFMLLAVYLNPVATEVVFGTPEEVLNQKTLGNIAAMNPSEYEGQRIILKGCSKRSIGFNAYGALAAKLQPVVKTLMFGEPCSTVPVYKKR